MHGPNSPTEEETLMFNIAAAVLWFNLHLHLKMTSLVPPPKKQNLVLNSNERKWYLLIDLFIY